MSKKLTKDESNRINSANSTGPISVAGKMASSQNARKHGLTSTHLIVSGESREQFDELLLELQQEFRPEGTLEWVLVERIAIAIWRQRRIVRAESAQIQLMQRTCIYNLHTQIKQAAGFPVNEHEVLQEMVGTSRFNPEKTAEEYLNIMRRWEDALEEELNLQTLQIQYPDIFVELVTDAGAEANVPKYLKDEWGTLQKYLQRVFGIYESLWKQASTKQIVSLYKESIALPKKPEIMTRYQAAIDNELYKAMRALKEAQAWREQRRIVTADVVDETESVVEVESS